MNTQVSMKVGKGAVFTILASLAVLAALAITLATSATSANRQQGRGRMIRAPQQSEAQSTQPSDAPQIVLDQEAQSALAEIVKNERSSNSINSLRSNSINSLFDTRNIRFDVAENGVSLRYEIKVVVR